MWFFVIGLGLIKCGQRGTLSGGPKDTIPPVLINVSPKMNTIKFDKKEIKMTFDEFIILKDINNQLIISPPIELENYTLNPRTGATKKITIKLTEPLNPNTTYTFNFGQGIADYNEGNILPSLAYVLSTGDVIDSLTLSGFVADAIELLPVSNISLQLYPIDSTYTDSIVYLEKPLYVANTLDSTYFKFQNLKEGKYQIIALDDQNKNYLYDQSFDKIGFSNQLIELPKDTLVSLRIFKEIVDFSWDIPKYFNDNLILWGYFGKHTDQEMEMISQVPETFESMITHSEETDTLFYWFKGAELDSLKFRYPSKDTILTRTLRFIDPIEDSLVIRPLTSNTLHLNKTFELNSNRPIVKIDTTQISIIDVDSAAVAYNAIIDENKHKISLDFEVTPNDEYQLWLYPGALVDFFDSTNDTLELSTKSLGVEDYGSIIVSVIANSDLPYILQVVDAKGELIQSKQKNPEDETYIFQYLQPQTYFIRLVKDMNNNGQWDTGNFLKKIQPEQVVYLPDTLELKANWEFNEQFNVEQIDLGLSEIQADSLPN